MSLVQLSYTDACRGEFSEEKNPVNYETDPQAWWRTAWWKAATKLELKIVAQRLLDIVPHATNIKRVFSMLGWIHSKSRNRLRNATVANMAKIRLHHLNTG